MFYHNKNLIAQSRLQAPTDSDSIRSRSRSPISTASCRPVSPMTSKMWNSLFNYMHDMIDTRLSRNDIGDVCTCMSGGKTHLHMAMTYVDSGSHISPLTYGQNMTRDQLSYHAEHNAIQKLPNRYSKKLLPINIFVLKTTMTGIIGNSKPCAHCLAIMSSLPVKKGYRVANILYTNLDGNIEKKKLIDMFSEDLHFSRLYADNNYKLKVRHR